MNVLETVGLLALLAYMLASQLGRRPVTSKSLRRPLLMAAALFCLLVVGVPLIGGNPELFVLSILSGAILGLIAAACVRLEYVKGTLQTVAGWPYATVWVVSIGSRLLFGWAAFHGFGAAIVQFINQQHLSGGDALRAAFGLMTVSEIVVRTGMVALRAQRLDPHAPTASARGRIAANR